MVKSNKNSKSFNKKKQGNPKNFGKSDGKKNFKFKNKNKAKNQTTSQEENKKIINKEKDRDT